MISRILHTELESRLFGGKLLVLYGPRQVGKTTLVKSLVEAHRGLYINCDIQDNRQSLQTTNPHQLKTVLGSNTLVVIDEAQRVSDIGITLKVIHDVFPEIQIVATGSSSFDLANKINEPLTGRALTFFLYPLSLEEIRQSQQLTLGEPLELIMRYGSYPGIVLTDPAQEKQLQLNQLVESYLYKDLLSWGLVKKPQVMTDLLQLLAFQLGSEVSYRELATTLGVAQETVENYLDLLEKTFVIFRLRSFSRNLRKEIAKGFKVYFYDLGFRNHLISQFNPLNLRNDVGQLWENLMIVERRKRNDYTHQFVKPYFWRTYDQQEIDYLEDAEGTLSAFEFKYSAHKKVKAPKGFRGNYPDADFMMIHSDNYLDFVS